jgi:alkanesulfonate monooxygenase SsuD/methylene tetrahydromethanopterin reductase-like flavin-dependent oxidoreductase (luciferase family)
VTGEPRGYAPQHGLGLFVEVETDADPIACYQRNLDIVAFAESLGYESAWVAVRHFGALSGGLASALPFLAAASQRTSGIRLGTAVIPISFEQPIRLAEDASLVDALSGGRLELGVGKGLGRGVSTSSFRAFGLDESRREELYRDALARLRDALAGSIDGTVRLYPPPRGLLERIWQATSQEESAAAIGLAGDRLQLHRSVPGQDTGAVQTRLIERYLVNHSGVGGPPRIGVSRAVIVTGGRDAHQRSTETGALVGTVDEVIEALLADAAVRRSTDVLFTVPLPSRSEAYREAISLLAREVFPRLELARYSTAEPIGVRAIGAFSEGARHD